MLGMLMFYKFVVLAAMINMGLCLMRNGQHEKAFPLLERSLAILREHLPTDHWHVAVGEIIIFMKVAEVINFSDFDKCK